MKVINIYFKRTHDVIPYNYANKLHGFVCNLMGDNNYGKMNHKFLYTYIQNVDYTKQGIVIKGTPFISIRLSDNDIDSQLSFVKNISMKPSLYINKDIILNVDKFSIDDVKTNKTIFRTCKHSPLLLSNKYYKFRYLTNDEKTKLDIEKYLIQNVKNKAKYCNQIIDENLSIKIIEESNPKTIHYRGCYNNGRIFKLQINANQETIDFILLNGLGRSCGCGFGFIY